MKKVKLYKHSVPTAFVGKIRLQSYLKGLFPYLETGSAVKKALKRKQINLNGKLGNSGDWITAKSIIEFEWSYHISETNAEAIDIVFEDAHLMIVRKPPGISSSGNTKSFQKQLQGIRIKDSSHGLPFPHLVHRLDKATEGLLIAAKTIVARRLLAKMMEDNLLVKQYVLIVEGYLPKSLKSINFSIDGKIAKTEILRFISLGTKDPTTKVFVRLHTGRTHQIRKHFTILKHPLVGDNLYNNGGLNFKTGLLLCAYHLSFEHPITHETVQISLPIPNKIDKYK